MKDDLNNFFSDKISQIKVSVKKWHRDLLHLLEIIYGQQLLTKNDELRNIILYESFEEAIKEIEQNAYYYFSDPKISNDRSLLNIENKPFFIEGENLKEDEVFEFLKSKSGFKTYLINAVRKISLEEFQKAKEEKFDRLEDGILNIYNDYKNVNNELSVAHSILKDRFKKKNKKANSHKEFKIDFVKEFIPEIKERIKREAENCRKNGKINFRKLGRSLGVSHPTAKNWCKKLFIKEIIPQLDSFDRNHPKIFIKAKRRTKKGTR